MDWIYRLFRPCKHEWLVQAILSDRGPPIEVQICGKCWRVRYQREGNQSCL